MDVAPAFRIAPTDVNSTLGALLVGTFLCLILYGATVYQVHRYFEVYVQDRNLIKGYVICVFSIETFHMFTCAHACYTLLVTGYSSAGTLVRGGWSLWSQPIICTVEICVVQSFYARRAFLLRPKSAPVVAIACVFSIIGIALATAASVEIVDNPADSAHSPLYKRLLSAAFGSIMAADILITGMLIVVLNNSRTGMKKMDHVIDRLIRYAVNTGLLTSILNCLGLILILVLPTLVPVGIAIVVTKSAPPRPSPTYGNCVLIALNARQSHTETTGRAQGGLPVGAHFVSTQAETLDLPSAQELWRPQQPKAIVSDTVIELKPCYRGLDRLQ